MKTRIQSIVIAIMFLLDALLPQVRAITPAPDGCYSNYTTAEGCNALGQLAGGIANSGLGWAALLSDTSGNYNTAVGTGALALNNADANTAVGVAALILNTSGAENTATGAAALLYNDSTGNGLANYNSAFGAHALQGNIDGISNSAFGWSALTANTTGTNNTATGYVALNQNTTGSLNTADGNGALYGNTEGRDNTATGTDALFSNTTGSYNTAHGDQAVYNNTTGFNNTATGYQALYSHHDGDANTADGVQALYTNQSGLDNTAVGAYALYSTTGTGNTAIGAQAGVYTDGEGSVFIGQGVDPGGAVYNQTYIRNINHTSVSGGNADYVTVDLTTGLLGHLSSSRRYKEQIKPMNHASELLYRLKPATYRYKKEIDRIQSPAFGLIAEEVAEVNPGLVACNAQGQPESVHYEMVNAMLLNEFLKEHKVVQEQGAIIARQQKQIDALIAGLQKVSAQLELNKSAPQTAQNNQ